MNFWPWVSRRAYDEVVAERDRLRERNDELTDQLIRLKRVQNGRPETPLEPKGKREPIPEGLRSLVKGFESKATRIKLLQQARRENAKGRSWEDIKADLERQIEANSVR